LEVVPLTRFRVERDTVGIVDDREAEERRGDRISRRHENKEASAWPAPLISPFAAETIVTPCGFSRAESRRVRKFSRRDILGDRIAFGSSVPARRSSRDVDTSALELDRRLGTLTPWIGYRLLSPSCSCCSPAGSIASSRT
jgi:hypothetical protein